MAADDAGIGRLLAGEHPGRIAGAQQRGRRPRPGEAQRARQDGEMALDAREGRERPGLGDVGDAEPPVEIVHAAAGRMDGNVPGRAPAVLPGLRTTLRCRGSATRASPGDQRVGPDAAPEHFRQQLGGIAEQPDEIAVVAVVTISSASSRLSAARSR